MTRLALMRHGHTSWNRAGRIQGRSDIPLDDAARADLAQVQIPESWADADLWSSPLSRAVETARIVSGGREPQTSAALTEMNWGDWEGKRGADLRTDPASGFRDIEDWGWDFRPLRGESAREMRDRLAPWMNALTGDTLAVCHIGVMRVCLAIAHGWDFAGPCPFQIKRNRLYILKRNGNRWRAERYALRLEKL